MANLPQISSLFISNLAAVYIGYEKQFLLGHLEKDDEMLDQKRIFNETYKCRLCTAQFNSPEELRIHRVVNHKGYMLQLRIKR
jgi:hypothetical protein